LAQNSVLFFGSLKKLKRGIYLIGPAIAALKTPKFVPIAVDLRDISCKWAGDRPFTLVPPVDILAIHSWQQ
jgi:hypothetical protein